MKPRLRTEWAVSSKKDLILACCLSPMIRLVRVEKIVTRKMFIKSTFDTTFDDR